MCIWGILKARGGNLQRALALALLLGVAQAPKAASPDAEVSEQLYLQALQAMASGDLALAEQHLKQLMQARPEHAGAWLDLAVLYCQLGDAANASALWAEVEARFAPPPAILQLIALQRSQGCTPPPPPPTAVTQLQLGRGQASNVNQGVRDLTVGLPGPAGTLVLELLPQYAPKADGYTVWGLGIQQPLNAQGLLGFAHWQGLRFDQEHPYNLQDFTLGLAQPWARGGWQGQWQAGLGAALLGGRLYQRHAQGYANATPPWQPWPQGQWRLAGSASHWAYPSLDGFDAWQWDLRTEWAQRTPTTQTSAHLGWAWDNGSTQRPGGDRQGWHLGVQWQHKLNTEMGGHPLVAEAGASLQHWRGRSAYAPGFINQARAQRTAQFTAKLVWPQNHGAHWEIKARHVRNDENIGLFAYDATSLQLSWHKRWGSKQR